MITVTSEYLNENWKELNAKSKLPVALYEWDGGDAYVISSLGQFPSLKSINATVVLGDASVSNTPIIIRLRKIENDPKSGGYMSPDGDLYAAAGERIANNGVQAIAVKIIDVAKTLAERRKTFLETDLLRDSAVAIVGLGTGGIHVATELAKSGVGKFYLIDPERLDVGNVCRHQAGVSCVGRKKVFAARDLILEKNPKAATEAYPIAANEENRKELIPIIEKSDIVVCATDSRQSKLFVNSLCIETKKPVIFGGAFRRAYGGLVLRVRPHETACYHCFVLAMPEKEADQEISSEQNVNDIAYADMPVSIEPGLSVDVAPIDIMVSKIALQELIKNKESTLHILDKDFEANWYLWINRPEPKTEYATLPPLSESYDEMTILRWYAVSFEKDPGCPACGDFSKALSDQYGLDLKTLKLPAAPSILQKEIIK